MQFRDLNKNGVMDPYEDPCCPIERRVEDLLGRMTLEEKAGMMFHAVIVMNEDGTLVEGDGQFGPFSTSGMVIGRLLNHFNVLPVAKPRQMAEWYNRLQQLAESARLGIPVTISSDPRHAFSDNNANSVFAGTFSRWPDPVGLAATGDPALVREFTDLARQEYLSVGIRVALHPMGDLATEPRWGRIAGTFGEDADLSSLMASAYIRGFQGETLGPQSVACMTKHFPGGGPQKDGQDSHYSFAKEQIYPGNNFDYHLIPFESAFEAHTAQIMLYYSVPVGTPFEAVGFGFNRDIVGGLLREKYGFEGVVCTDWEMLTSQKIKGQVMEARAWGVEHLSVAQRAMKAIEAGVDQFGGESCPEVIVELVRSGHLSEARIDASVRRLLRDKFRLGLFDNPYIDPADAERIVGNAAIRAAGELAQRKSVVLLKNSGTAFGRILPLSGRPRIYIENIAPDVACAYGDVVPTPAEADVAILRLQAPYEPRGDYLEAVYRIHTGDLDFKEDEKQRILGIMAQVPTIVDIYLDRPAVIPEIAEHSAALLANFGASDEAVLDIIFGRFSPSATLPFELPSSMEAVRRRRGDMPRDSDNPLFSFGYGLTYGLIGNYELRVTSYELRP
jgi:beta-glucosidase